MHENAVSKAFFCASMVIIIGNGSRINFWQDHWLDGCRRACARSLSGCVKPQTEDSPGEFT
jgi:hypothetical protein